ncbi:unnamed protein product [Brassicogethes aeneus]|uniref:Major facilitator superfamily (MFS) profile domain-containing protein n=1 Tax=Brassicogethes aeneus TaxID=1431903 RepID=A0A9P0BFS0_BRAAE|nr:unnamed protein product [Brassicogethes aeneus]
MAVERLSDIDNILSIVGDFGRSQIILLLLFCYINVLSAFHYFGQTIISVIPSYKCNYDGALKNDSYLIVVEQCKALVWENDEAVEKNCDAYTYDTKNIMGFTGIIQDMDWVCNNDWKAPVGQSLFFIGSVLGTLIFGYFSDKTGRVVVLIFANMLVVLGTLVTLASNNLLIFSAGRFLAGAATDTNFVMMYIIVLEYIRPSLRTLGLNLCIGIFYTLACMCVPWIAVALKSWKLFLIFVATPHMLVLLFYYVVPESAQWLMSKGKIEKAIECYKRIAKSNGKTLSDDVISSIKSYGSNMPRNQKQENFLGLLRTPNLRRKTLILIFKSMVMTLCYDTISRNINGLGYSPFIIFSMSSSTILPSCLLITSIQDKIGRKALASGFLFISAICTSASGLVQSLTAKPGAPLILVLAILARLSINITYNSGAQYAVELIPTVVRGQGVSFVHVAGYAATFFSPHILYMAEFWKPAPEIILAVLLVCGAIACLFLPETLNRTLPVSLDDGEKFGEDEQFFDFIFCGGSITESTIQLNPGGQLNSYM